MSLTTKLKILAEAAKYDVSCASGGSRRAGSKDGLGHSDGHSICHSFTPDGRCVSLLKILLTNHCVYDCVFCVNRISSDIPRAAFTPQEVVDLTLDFYRRNYIEGLFLSSGIFRSPDDTMEQLVAVVRTLRQTHRFGGYIHLKAIPGASQRLIEEAGRWVDRLSANIELPTQADMAQLAPDKQMAVIEGTMAQIQEGVQTARVEQAGQRSSPTFAPAGQSTQMVIGATPSPDAVILATAAKLYQRYGLKRVYYSAFSPYPHADPRLPLQAPALLREHRLYQADWLTRFYGFSMDELTTADDPNLSFDLDPKLAWALRHRERFPVDVNRAPREALLRVPGLGYKNVARILSIRRYHRITLDDLRKLRVPLRRVRPFVVTPAYSERLLRLDREDLPALLSKPAQLELFSASLESTFGQL
ncbi:MAG: biotin synthase related domain containing protein [Nitrospira sp.]|jgi:putative DNA modification/repair radical SAM protein|nr:biotin synthase related domain containing protein [Nitrospira sp.]